MATTKKGIWGWIIAILIAIILIGILSITTCAGISGKKALQAELDRIRNDSVTFVQNFEKQVDSLGRETIRQREVILNREQALALYIIKSDNEFKLIKSQIGIKTITVVKEINVPYKDSSNVVVFDTTAYMKLPQNFAYDTRYLQFQAYVDTNGLMIGNLAIPNEQLITIGIKNRGLLTKGESTVKITNSNPYMFITALNNVTIVEEQKWYQNRWFHMGLSALFGAALTEGVHQGVQNYKK